MRIAIVYTGFTSYMTDCWRALARHPDVVLKIWLEDMPAYRFQGDRGVLSRGLDLRWEYSEALTEDALRAMAGEISAFTPDVIFICGWSHRLPPYVAAVGSLAHIPMVLDMDMPWEWTLRKVAARFVLHHRLQRFSSVFVPGRKSARYARWLGFPAKSIYTGRNCIEISQFEPQRVKANAFVYMGRRSPEKGLDLLRAAYSLYRRQGGLWELEIPDFIEPCKVPDFLSSRACFILPSQWEPWGVVVLEALAAGMRVIVSDRVGAREDLPVDEVFKSGDARGLAESMHRIELLGPRKGPVGEIENYTCARWVKRVLQICEDVV